MKNTDKLYHSLLNYSTHRGRSGNLRLLVLCASFVMLLQLFPNTAFSQIPNPSDPVCAYCNARITRGESHKSNCPYYSNTGGGGTEPRRNSADINLEHRNRRSLTVNEKGNSAYSSREYGRAVRYYRRALWFNPFDETIKQNLASAKEKRRLKRDRPTKPVYHSVTKPQVAQTVIDKPSANSKEGRVFNSAVEDEKKVYLSQLDILRKNMRGVVPPLTNPVKNIHEGIILGTTNTQENNAVVRLNLKSPFNDAADQHFASSADSSLWDFKRAILDNITSAQYTLNQTEYGRELVKKLNGTHFDRLIAHSNGGTVANALIQEGVITVDELNIIGGDRSYVNWAEYNALIASGKVKRIVVWVNPGDVVPFGTSLTGILHTLKFAKYFEEYCADKLMGSKGGHNVEYRLLDESEYKCGDGPVASHGIDCYFYNMKKYFDRKQ